MLLMSTAKIYSVLSWKNRSTILARLSKCKDINARDYITRQTFLMYLLDIRNPELNTEEKLCGVIRELLKKNIDVNARDYSGKTALHYAVEERRVKVIDLLLKHGADININCKEGNTVLHYLRHKVAKWNIDEILVKKLIKQGVNVNSKNVKGATPLMEAAISGHFELIQCLLDHGANVHCFLYSNLNTALHLAVKNGHRDAVRVLLKNGAHVNAQNRFAATPLHYAYRRNNGELIASAYIGIIELLYEFGAGILVEDCVCNESGLNCLLSGDRNLRITKQLSRHNTCLRVAELPYFNKGIHNLPDKLILYPNSMYMKGLDKMKSYKINSDVSLFDLLHMDVNRFVTYLNRPAVKHVFDSANDFSTLRKEFVCYYYVLLTRYRVGEYRKFMLDSAKAVLEELYSFSCFPYHICEQILSYLTNADLCSILISVESNTFS